MWDIVWVAPHLHRLLSARWDIVWVAPHLHRLLSARWDIVWVAPHLHRLLSARWDIVWVAPHLHRLLSARWHIVWVAPHLHRLLSARWHIVWVAPHLHRLLSARWDIVWLAPHLHRLLSARWDIVWLAPHLHRLLSARLQSLQQAPQCPWFVLKWFRVHRCFLDRPNAGGRIVGSWTKSQLTTEAELQSSHHWEVMSNGCMSDHRGMHDVNRCWGGWRRSILRGHTWCTVVVRNSQSVSGTLDRLRVVADRPWVVADRPRVVAPSKTCGHVRSSRKKQLQIIMLYYKKTINHTNVVETRLWRFSIWRLLSLIYHSFIHSLPFINLHCQSLTFIAIHTCHWLLSIASH